MLNFATYVAGQGLRGSVFVSEGGVFVLELESLNGR